MSYHALRIRVAAAEQALVERSAQAKAEWNKLQAGTRAALTPGRVLGSGFIVGLTVGSVEPLALAERSVRLAQLGMRLVDLGTALEARISK